MRRLAPPLPQNSAGTPQVVPKLLIPQRFVKESALSYPNRCATVSGRCSFFLVWESPAEEQRPDPSVYASVERHNVAKIPGPVNTFLLRRVARLGPGFPAWVGKSKSFRRNPRHLGLGAYPNISFTLPSKARIMG